jgi:8-oxo-dGTP pyrophosphatase MutT (NUDIX family)
MNFKSVNKEHIFSTPRFEVVRDEILIDNDTIQQHYYLNKPNAVLIIPVYNDNIGLIKTFRPAIKKESYELIGGRIEANEKPINTALREFKEECGLKPTNLSYFSDIHPLPSITNEKVYIFQAEIEDLNPISLEKSELILDLNFYSLDQIKEYLLTGKFASAIDAFALSIYLISKL